jgi:hypothetical protein
MASNGPYISSTQVASSTPFDNSTSKGYVGSDVQTALEELRDHTIYDSRTQATSNNGTLTLTVSDLNLQFLTGTGTNYTVQLPSATTLSLSAYYQIINTSNQVVNVNDGSGTLLFKLGQNSIGFITLQLNVTAAGTWIWWQTSYNVASGVVSYNIVSSTNFTSSANVDTLITGMTVTPQAGTYAIWYNAQNTATGSGQQLDVTLYKGASAITDSKRTNLSTSGSHIFQNSTMTIAQFDGATACQVEVNPNGNSITVGQRSLLLIRLGT